MEGVWSLQVPSKIKVFLWTAFQNALPTMSNLRESKCTESAIYGICFQEEESLEHMLLCEWTRGVWLAGCFGLKIDKQAVKTFDQWLLQVFSGLNADHENWD